mmetsp:Transcript_8282/g.28376  ORF Transcript_8282/g.28376 Transcript_8282/m.28376 type:complete len:293 (-) Transcript_8282:328-1206(-)
MPSSFSAARTSASVDSADSACARATADMAPRPKATMEPVDVAASSARWSALSSCATRVAFDARWSASWRRALRLSWRQSSRMFVASWADARSARRSARDAWSLTQDARASFLFATRAANTRAGDASATSAAQFRRCSTSPARFTAAADASRAARSHRSRIASHWTIHRWWSSHAAISPLSPPSSCTFASPRAMVVWSQATPTRTVMGATFRAASASSLRAAHCSGASKQKLLKRGSLLSSGCARSRSTKVWPDARSQAASSLFSGASPSADASAEDAKETSGPGGTTAPGTA